MSLNVIQNDLYFMSEDNFFALFSDIFNLIFFWFIILMENIFSALKNKRKESPTRGSPEDYAPHSSLKVRSSNRLPLFQ